MLVLHLVSSSFGVGISWVKVLLNLQPGRIYPNALLISEKSRLDYCDATGFGESSANLKRGDFLSGVRDCLVQTDPGPPTCLLLMTLLHEQMKKKKKNLQLELCHFYILDILKETFRPEAMLLEKGLSR